MMENVEKKPGKNEGQSKGQSVHLKYEIAEELGLADKIAAHGWKSLTARESGRIGGIMAKRQREDASQAED